MSPTPPHPEPADRARQRDEDAQYYRGILHELVEMATDIARAVHRQATAEQPAEHGPAQALAPDPTIAFDRIARTIRRTIALARKLAEPAPLSPAAQAAERRRSARKQIIREVEDTIHRDVHGPDAEARAESLHTELYERLDTLDLDDDIDTLPIADIVAAIRRDLGIAAHINSRGISPWKRRRPADVRDLCARAAAQPKAAAKAADRAGERIGDPRLPPAPSTRTRTGTGPPAP